MFIFSAAQYEAIRTARDEGRFADAYDLIVRFATDDAGNPLEGVQAEALIWFEGAADVNRGVGPFSSFIRTYTSNQSEIRFGSSLSQSELQRASDDIAVAVLANVLLQRSVPTIDGRHVRGDHLP